MGIYDQFGTQNTHTHTHTQKVKTGNKIERAVLRRHCGHKGKVLLDEDDDGDG